MEKTQADRLILQYRTKIFGFALSKLRRLSDAEELAADIVCEVYRSFLTAEQIANPDGYVYRIAYNVYAKYIRRLTHVSTADLLNVTLPYHDDTQEHLEQEERFQQLRREISFLSKRQRTIVYLYYYQKNTITEIAEKLEISPGTIKWHLSDARTTLKEELVMMQQTTDLTVNPIQFTNMGHNGCAGSTGDTHDMFDTRLKQNIAWCCYFTPHTVEEIARAISVPPIYLADHVQKLEEYGYLDRLDQSRNPKFRTNMVLYDTRTPDETRPLFLEAAAKLCEELYPKIFFAFDKAEDNWGFSCAEHDKNFMKYTLVMLCTRYLFGHGDSETYRKFYQTYSVKRPDGGNFIAHADVSDDCHKANASDSPYAYCGYMQRYDPDGNMLNEQFNCRFAERSLDWRDNCSEDWDALYRFIQSQNDKSVLTPEEYKRLCDKGYLSEDKVQVMTYTCEEKPTWEHMIQLLCKHCPMPQSILEYGKDFDKRKYTLQRKQHPAHIQPIIRQYCTDSLGSGDIIPYVLEELLRRKMLQPLTAVQRKAVLSILIYQK